METNCYFDNAASSWPKPDAVIDAAGNYLRTTGANPGRSGHTRSLEGERLIYETRERLASFLGAGEACECVFAFNATDALNIAIKGFLKKGDHVILTAMEHNSVLRPVGSLQRSGIITATVVPCSPEGLPDLDIYERSFKQETRMVICSHASNVTGSILPVKTMGEIARTRDAVFLVDAAQTAGVLPVNARELEADLLVFTGHKSLLGPPGTGGLIVRSGIELQPWREGGTGSHSESDRHPETMPERLEAGTMNTPGLAGLNEGVKFIQSETLEKIRAHELKLCSELRRGLTGIPGIVLHGPSSEEQAVGIVSFTMEGMDSGELGFILEQTFGILCRTGLHCAPLAHRSLGTFPHGTVRLSPGYFNSISDVSFLLEAIAEIVSLKAN